MRCNCFLQRAIVGFNAFFPTGRANTSVFEYALDTKTHRQSTEIYIYFRITNAAQSPIHASGLR